MTKEELEKKIELTPQQIVALGNLRMAFQECTKEKLAFIFDGDNSSFVGVSVPKGVTLAYDDTIETNNSTSFTKCNLNQNDVLMEIGPVEFVSNQYDHLSWVEEINNETEG